VCSIFFFVRFRKRMSIDFATCKSSLWLILASLKLFSIYRIFPTVLYWKWQWIELAAAAGSLLLIECHEGGQLKLKLGQGHEDDVKRRGRLLHPRGLSPKTMCGSKFTPCQHFYLNCITLLYATNTLPYKSAVKHCTAYACYRHNGFCRTAFSRSPSCPTSIIF